MCARVSSGDSSDDRDERHVAALDRLRKDAGRALRPALEQQRHDVGMVVHHRHVDGAHLVEGVLGVDVGAAGDQQLDDLDVALVGGEGQRRCAVARFRVDVGAFVERRRDPGRVPGARRGPQLFGDRRGRLLSCRMPGLCVPLGISASDNTKIVIGNVIRVPPQRFYSATYPFLSRDIEFPRS